MKKEKKKSYSYGLGILVICVYICYINYLMSLSQDTYLPNMWF